MSRAMSLRTLGPSEPGFRFRVQGVVIRVQVSVFRVQGLGVRVEVRREGVCVCERGGVCGCERERVYVCEREGREPRGGGACPCGSQFKNNHLAEM